MNESIDPCRETSAARCGGATAPFSSTGSCSNQHSFLQKILFDFVQHLKALASRFPLSRASQEVTSVPRGEGFPCGSLYRGRRLRAEAAQERPGRGGQIPPRPLEAQVRLFPPTPSGMASVWLTSFFTVRSCLTLLFHPSTKIQHLVALKSITSNISL
jgi:hypothetical protein